MTTRTAPSIHILSHPAAIGVLAVLLGSIAGLLIGQMPSPVLLIALVGGAGVALATLINAEIGLLALTFIVYTRFSEAAALAFGTPSLVRPFIALLLVALIIHVVVKGNRPQGWMPAVLLFGAYGLVLLASVLWSVDARRSENGVAEYIQSIIMAMSAVLLIQRGSTLRRVAWVLVGVGIFLGTISLFQYLSNTFTDIYWGFAQTKTSVIVDGSGLLEYRIGGPFADSVFYAQLLLVLTPVAVDRFLHERSLLLRGLAAWSAVVCSLSIVFTFSRGGFLALCVVGALLLVRYRPPLPALIVAVVVAVPLIAILPESYTTRLNTIVEYMPFIGESDLRNDDSFRGRSSEMIIALQMFSDHPVLGVGIGNYNARYLEYSRWLGVDPRLEDRSAHSLYLEIAAENGLVGLAVFCTIVGIMFWRLEQARQALERAQLTQYAGIALAISLAMIGYLTAAIFLHLAFPRPFWLLFGIALAIPNVAKYELARREVSYGK